MNNKTIKNMKSIYYTFALCGLIWMFQACVSEMDSGSLNTKQQDQIMSFLEAEPAQYSDFIALLEKAELSSLLSAYGYYTCFAPTNEAMQNHYAESGISLDRMTKEECQDLAYTHLIKGRTPEDVLIVERLPNSRISLATMNDIFLNVVMTSEGGALRIEVQNAPLMKTTEVHNGVVHTVSKVLEMTNTPWEEVVNADDRFKLFTQALKETKLLDSLMRSVNNDLYDATREAVTNSDYKIATKIGYEKGKLYDTPAYCKYGFTVLRESDETLFNEAGIETFDDLKRYAAEVYDRLYENDKNETNITKRNNSLNRFIAYHILDRDVSISEFIPAKRYDFYSYGASLYEYVETLCPNTMMEVSAPGTGTGLFFNKKQDGSAVQIVKGDELSINGVCHEIDKILTYEGVEEELLSKRLRMDIASLMPELSTNRTRFILTTSFPSYIVPQNYFKNLTYSESTQLHYIASEGWGDCEGDEFLFVGKYDFTLRIPPVPAGTYEVRIGYTANAERGVAQLYLDKKPCDIPLDMTILASNPKIGWKKDDTTTDSGIENDKMMRNRGYLKGPASVLLKSSKEPLRDNGQALRRVVTVAEFSRTESHELRVKSVEEVLSRQFHLDYIELVPSNVWENEDRN
jgi:uncharacterized surface protein with fasciclin (FAS1) repeats